ncbi:MAG: efflux RND transporter periplasmic adaptor subunit [Planctomycetes bacterium]|nr:efflux RND transporter periplasmic adaptor subunit [Planctomycetota bacterium]
MRVARWVALMGGLVVLAGIAGRTTWSTWLPVWAAGAGSEASPSQRAVAEPEVPVVIVAVEERPFEDRVTTWGTAKSKRYALVSARVPGTLDAVYVDEGDRVEAGRTKLFQTDALKLQKAVAIAEKALKVAEASLAEKRARLEQAVAEKNQLERDVARFRRLVAENAFPRQQLEQLEMRLVQAQAAIKDVQALIELDQAQLEQARLNLDIARKDLADSLVLAPISGVVTERYKEPGEMAGAGTPVVRVEDPSVQEISAFLPGEVYGRVVTGKTVMRLSLGGKSLGVFPVTYRSPRIDEELRTFEVKATVESPPPELVPGCLVKVDVVLETRRGLAVPSEAIARRIKGDYIFVVEGRKAKRVPVRRRSEQDGWVEIVAEGVREGDEVAVKGVDLLEDGSRVTVVEESEE